jgi:methylphosphotriester-DNA--protein-cysteine methyltransferase
VLGDAVALHPAVRRALKLLSERTLNGDLSTLAKNCGVSDAYLSRTFRRQVGVPLSRYRNSLRLSRFWENYRQDERKTMAQAVYAAGFGSYAQFYKVFAQVYGRGPRASLPQRASPPLPRRAAFS